MAGAITVNSTLEDLVRVRQARQSLREEMTRAVGDCDRREREFIRRLVNLARNQGRPLEKFGDTYQCHWRGKLVTVTRLGDGKFDVYIDAIDQV